MDRRDFVIGAAALSASNTLNLRKAATVGNQTQRLIALDAPGPGVHVFEPHIAFDPRNPDRIAVSAQYGIRGGRGGRNIQLWVSEDGGRRWFSRRVPRPKLDGEFAADGLVGFVADGGLLIASDFAGRWIADLNDGSSYSRGTLPTHQQFQQHMAQMMGQPAQVVATGGIAVSRSGDRGRTLSATVVPGISPGADKTSMAFDRSPTSPHRDTVYLSWSDMTPAIRITKSTDGGRTFAEPFVMKTTALAPMHQIAVRPDGSVHLLWTLGGLPGLPDQLSQTSGNGLNAPNAILHAVSTDGGTTFAAPKVVATHAGLGKVGIPSLAADPNGALLWVWGQTDVLPDIDARPPVQARHRLFGIRSDDGVTWSAPYELCPSIAAGTHMGLPAVTSNGSAWWLLAYLADDRETRVVLLRADREAQRFEVARTLARRPFPADQIALMASYMLRFCDQDTPQVGDYVGISTVGSRIGTAFVLPFTDEPTSRATVFVALNEIG